MTPTEMKMVRAAAGRLAVVSAAHGYGAITRKIEDVYSDLEPCQLAADIAALSRFALDELPADGEDASKGTTTGKELES